MEWLKKHWIVFVLAICVFSYVMFDTLRTPSPVTDELEILTNDISIKNQEEEVVDDEQNDMMQFVDVKGAVTNPGVYEIPNNETRVSDVIKMAGGFTDEAATDAINLAQRVFDEMVIIVPIKGEEVPIPTGQASGQGGKVRLNIASIEEISQLNGIGEVKASAIIQYREENGPFQNVEELLQISGIGDKTLEKIKDQIQVP